jgi:hypothetical protein
MKIWKRDYYEKLIAQQKEAKTVDYYFEVISEAKKKIKELQDNCKHEEFIVGFWSWRPGTMIPSRICKACHHRISDATPEESYALRKEHSDKQNAAIKEMENAAKK